MNKTKKKIFKKLKKYLKKYPEIRFVQALYNINIITSDDNYYMEDHTVLKKIKDEKNCNC